MDVLSVWSPGSVCAPERKAASCNAILRRWRRERNRDPTVSRSIRAIAQHYSELMDKTRRLLDFPITGNARDLSSLFHSAMSIVGGRRQISEATVRPDGFVVAFPLGSTARA